ncbi:NAD-dependent epimerase/dehydratase family protein [Streptomyces sp. KL116D]|uniref:NAD-dependent epimerase/dehydratase family protein n=1 Tax=Streptomyces sp. KL116D TaxID=3045152 RepID=UPI0035568F84
MLATHRVLEASTRIGVPGWSSPPRPASTDRPTATRAARPTASASPYAVTKLAEEQLCLAYAERPIGPSVVALRYFTVCGASAPTCSPTAPCTPP